MAAKALIGDPGIRDTLCGIIRSKGASVCRDEAVVVSLLKDLLPQSSPLVSLLGTAMRENVARDLLDWQEDSGPLEIVLQKCEGRLVTNQFIEAAGARWAVLCWSVALGRMSASEMDRRLGVPAPAHVDPPVPAPAPKPTPQPPAVAPVKGGSPGNDQPKKLEFGKPAPANLQPTPAKAKKPLTFETVAGIGAAILMMCAAVFVGWKVLEYLVVDLKWSPQAIWIAGLAVVGIFKLIKSLSS